ncbi:MAG: hypothetical protein ABJO09_00995 [Hyphomicrobiales bacterium]
MKTITGRPAPGARLLDPANGYRPISNDMDSTLPRNSYWRRATLRGDFLETKSTPKPATKQTAEKVSKTMNEEKG